MPSKGNSLPERTRRSKGRKSRKSRGDKSRGQGDGGPGGQNVIPRVVSRNDTDIQARWMPVFPARTTRKLRYSTSAYLAGTSGVVASHVFAANGLYDPDITGSGHQPMGFDQMMLSYQHYAVTSARLKITFHNLAASSPVISIKVDGAATPVTVVDTILEQGINTHSALEAKSTFGSVKVLESQVSIRKFEGIKDIVDVTDLKGSVAANPAELTYFHVQCWDNAGVTTNILMEAVLEFSAIFMEPRDLTASLSRLLGDLVREQDLAHSDLATLTAAVESKQHSSRRVYQACAASGYDPPATFTPEMRRILALTMGAKPV